MKPFLLRFCGCLWAVFTLVALDGFITTPTWGAALMLALYAAAALQCCRVSRRNAKRRHEGGEMQGCGHKKRLSRAATRTFLPSFPKGSDCKKFTQYNNNT